MTAKGTWQRMATAKEHLWKKQLSIRPRRCYWTGDYIRPFTYAMKTTGYAHTTFKVIHPRWVSMSNFVLLRLKGKI